MGKEKEKKDYRKEVVLVIVGAVLASIPTLISTYIQSRTQLQQLIIDKRVNALKDYAITFNKFATEIAPKFEKLEKKIDALEDKYSKQQITFEEIDSQLDEELMNIEFQIDSWKADVNVNRMVINSLFQTNFETFQLNLPSDPKQETEQHSEPVEQVLKSHKERIAKLKTRSLQIVDEEQEKINNLALRLQQ
ncbi:MAG TPA: hypothetical protein VJ843_05215 [Candidatus Saccharimonadales bacterium]|nr:hypothetical protein [Candidatus Saccharimonadales bacterium]